MRETFIAMLPFLTTLLVMLLGVGAARLGSLMRAKGASELWVRSLEAVSTAAGIVVRNAEQTVVANLKDKNKPGEWNAIAAMSVKESAIRDVKEFARTAIRELKRRGLSDAKVDELVSQAVESAVLELRSSHHEK